METDSLMAKPELKEYVLERRGSAAAVEGRTSTCDPKSLVLYCTVL